jgi:hypothetical protein
MAANHSPPKYFYKIKNKPTRFRNRLYTYRANNKASIMKDLNEELREMIRIDEQIIHADPGIYTWIIKGDRKRHFYATRVFSEQEIGTLHQDIHRQTGNSSSPLCAGELEVLPNGRIEFNIQSGTYTRDMNKFRPTKDMALVMVPELRDDIQRDALELYEKISRPNESNSNSVSLEEIEKIIGMRRPEAQLIKKRIIRRINLYKRNRMVDAVKEMLCSFFEKNNGREKVIFLKGGNDDLYIENGTLGNNAEVLAGKSLLSKELITTNANRNRLNIIFKVNTRKQNHS